MASTLDPRAIRELSESIRKAHATPVAVQFPARIGRPRSASSVLSIGVVVCCGPRGPTLDPESEIETYWVADAIISNTDGDPTLAITVAPKETPKASTLTTRTSNTVGTLTAATSDHGVQSGDSLDLAWSGGSRTGVTVGTVATDQIPFTGGTGDNLPAATTAITYLDKTTGREYVNWVIRLCTNEAEIVAHTHLVPVGEMVEIHSKPDQSDPVLTRWFFSLVPWFFFAFLAGYCSACGTEVTRGFAEFYPHKWRPFISAEIGDEPDTESVAVHDSCIWQDKRYAVGDFTNLGGVGSNNYTVAYWDDDLAKWVGVAGSVERIGSTNIRCLVHDFGAGEVLVVSGGGVGTYTDHPVQTWNGSTWTELAAVQTGHTWVAYCSYVWNGDLYIGGLTDATCTIKGIAKYSGGSWSALGTAPGLGDSGGGGTNPTPEVWAIEAHDDGSAAGEQLYAAGNFILAGGLTVANVARWSGSAWSATGTGIEIGGSATAVRALKSWDDGENNILYAGGIGLATGACVVGWDGNSWERHSDDLSIMSGTGNTEVNTLEVANGYLIVAGHFQYRADGVGMGTAGGAVGFLAGTPDTWEPLA